MTESDPAQHFPPMHPITRLSRVIQQLKSFGELHAGELETLAAELDAANAADVAARVRIYRDVQRDEAQIVVDELIDLQSEIAANGQPDWVPAPERSAAGVNDPATNSPRRARWLAEQAAEEARRRQPLSRRDFFGGGPPKPDDAE